MQVLDVISFPRKKSMNQTNIKWHRGPPPHVGWWATKHALDFPSSRSSLKWWRWFDGQHWSRYSLEYETAKAAAKNAEIIMWGTNEIQWCDYWPENARVPRIDPRKGKTK